MTYAIQKDTVLASVTIRWNGAAAPAAPIFVDNLIQVISKDSATLRTVSWQNSVPRSDYAVEYRRQGTARTAWRRNVDAVFFITMGDLIDNGSSCYRRQSRMAYSFDYGNVHYALLNTDYEERYTAYPTMMEDALE